MFNTDNIINKEKILNSYISEQSEPGKPYVPTVFDKRCSEIATKYTEEELRGAVVMRANYNRTVLKKKK